MRKLLAGLTAVLVAASVVPVLAASGPRPLAVVDPLLEARLAEASGTDVLTVFVHADDAVASRRASEEAGLAVVETFDRVGVTVAAGPPAAVERVTRRTGVTYVEADRPIAFTTESSHRATRGDQVLRGAAPLPHGYDGSGVGIAVIDTGIDGTHPMFQRGGRSKVVRNLKLACHSATPACDASTGDANDSAWLDLGPVGDSDTPSLSGHGTHVASIAAGVPARTSDGRRLHGAAPGASLVGLSVGQFDSIYGGASALNWVLEHHGAPCGPGVPARDCPPVRVVNNSWSATGQYRPEDTASKLQDALVQSGVVVVWAAGNDGGDGSANVTNSWGSSPTGGIISVAAFDDGGNGARDGAVAAFSSRGRSSDVVTYPDVSAPGTDITAACRPILPICATGTDADPAYATLSGTSMAAPHVAGIVALLLQAKPSMTPGQIEDVLEDTAYQFASGALYVPDLADRNADHTTSFDKGHGLVDAHAAVAHVLGVGYEQKAAALPTCAGTRVIDDGRGDADHPSLDVTSAHMSWDGSRVVFKIEVDDLTDAYPEGATGVAYFVSFGAGRGHYFVSASRQLTDIGIEPAGPNAESFSIGHTEQTGPTTRYSTDHSGLPGRFDEAADAIVIWMRPADVAAANAALAEAGQPPMPMPADGTALRHLRVESNATRGGSVADAGASSLVPGDLGESTCDFTLGAGAIAKTPPRLGPPPPDAVVTPEDPVHRWTSRPTTDVIVPFTGENASGCTGGKDDQTCDITHIGVTPPPGGGALEITLSPPPPHDLYVYVYAPSGEMVVEAAARNARVDEVEPGVYTIVVRAFVMVEAAYDGEVRLHGAPASPAVSGADARLDDGATFEAEGTSPENNSSYSCGGPHDPRCVTYLLDLQPGTRRAALDVVLTSDVIGAAIDDFDFVLYDAHGRELGGSGNVQTVYEAATIDIPAAGAYYLVVQPFTASTESPYRITATLRVS